MSKAKSDVEHVFAEGTEAASPQASDGSISCAICGAAVSLESCKTDEDGSAVHAECYFDKLYDRAGATDRKSSR